MFVFNTKKMLFHSTVSNNHLLRKTLALFLLCQLCFSPLTVLAQQSSDSNFTLQDFQNLRWLVGDWRGSENGKNDFYERYRFAGEDRIEMQSFKDRTMTEAGKDTSATFLKDGAIYHQVGRAVWVAERFSKTEIAFAPKESARNSFVWKSESPDVWTAKLNFKNREGQSVENVYRLERIKNDAKNGEKAGSQTINASSKNTDDRELIRRAALDYVEGVYEVDPSKIERGVHPELAKRGFFAKRGETAYAEYKMTFAELVELSKKYYAKTKPPADAPKEIVIFDVSDQTASVKLTAAWGIDYMHLAKYGGKWMIVNVLWQSPPR